LKDSLTPINEIKLKLKIDEITTNGDVSNITEKVGHQILNPE
jgi:hypothetical protein